MLMKSPVLAGLWDSFSAGLLPIRLSLREIDSDFPAIVRLVDFNIKFDTAVANSQSHSGLPLVDFDVRNLSERFEYFAPNLITG